MASELKDASEKNLNRMLYEEKTNRLRIVLTLEFTWSSAWHDLKLHKNTFRTIEI